MGIRFPKTVWIVPTTRCNTRCRTCPHFYSDYGQDMSDEVFARIESEVLDHVQQVHLVGGGEPLISKIFPAMLDACIRRKIKITFITNTIALTEEMVRRLVQNGAEIMVSIDGATAETYNSIRPLIRFERLLGKLKMIQAVRAEHPDNRVRLITNTVVMKRNLHELAQMVELAHTHGVDTAIFSDLIPHDLHPDFTTEVPVMYPDLLRAHVPPAVALAQEYGLNFEIPAYYWAISAAHPEPPADSASNASNSDTPAQGTGQPGLAYATKEFIFPQECHMPWTHANLLTNGDVSTCCTTDQPLGNILTQSFAEIWNGAPYQQVRRLIHTNNPPVACKHCNLGSGIAAGNPSFFSKFLSDNALESLALDDPRIRLSPAQRPDGTSVVVDGFLECDVDTGSAEFLTLRVTPAPGVTGQAVIGEHTHEFVLDDSAVLLPLGASASGPTRLRLEASGPFNLRGIDLLSYEHRATRGNKLLQSKFLGSLTLIHDQLAAALKREPQLRTAMIFGANVMGTELRKQAELLGLHVLGFTDNFIVYFDGAPVHPPEELQTLRPDVILIASRAHAAEIAAQIKELVHYAPTLIAG